LNQEKIMEILSYSAIMPYVTPKLQMKILRKIISLMENDIVIDKNEIELLNEFYQMVEISKRKEVEKFKRKNKHLWQDEKI